MMPPQGLPQGLPPQILQILMALQGGANPQGNVSLLPILQGLMGAQQAAPGMQNPISGAARPMIGGM